ncbi:hypothetical protein ACB092_08G030700 [Castanea dentata]
MKLKEVPKASKFREKGLENLQQLDRMFRDVAATGVIAWTFSSNTLPPTMPQEGVGDSSGSSKFKDNQCDMNMDIDSLLQGHASQSCSLGQKRTSESIPSLQEKKKKIGGVAKLDDHLRQLINVCENKSLAISQESPSSISNVMKIVRTLPTVKEDPNFVIQISYVLMKRSHREMFLMFKELESQLQWLQGMLLKQKK